MNRSVAVVLFAALVCVGCRDSGLPQPGSQKYIDLCSAFFLGLSGLQAGEDIRAKEYLTRSTEIAPGEPAGWADLGILQVRQQQFDAAFASLQKARGLAPGDSRVEALLGLIESRRGHLPEAIAHLKKAVTLDSHNVRALYSLAGETERQQGPDGAQNAQQLLGQILQQQPQNTAVWLDNLRLAAKRGDAAEVQRSLAALHPGIAAWPDAARTQFAVVQQSATGGNVRPAAVQAQFLRNVLLRDPAYRATLDQIKTSANLVAQPFTTFLKLPSPSSTPSAPDTATHFEPQPMNGVDAKPAWMGELVLSDTAAPVMAWADDRSLHLSTGAQLALPNGATLPTKISVVAADLDSDFKPDIVIATSSGLRIYRQQDPAHFQDITQTGKIPPTIAGASYTGVWPFDFDQDGDLDIVLGTGQGSPVVLRNNGDGTFTSVTPFKNTDGVKDFIAADLDGDGYPDVALIDRTGALNILLNRRGGIFAPYPLSAATGKDVAAMTVGDVNGDGVLDLLLLKSDGGVTRLSGPDWRTAELFHTSPTAAPALFTADLDNNGALDLVVNNRVYLNDGTKFTAQSSPLPAAPEAIADVNGDGRLDLIGVGSDGAPVTLINHGSKNYRWEVVRTKAAQSAGDQRINSFGIGGEVEIRAGLLTQKQIIRSPLLHFGLGDHQEVPFARIVWPNGVLQAEFELKPDQTLLAEQRIKGSCPLLFTWNGSEMHFVKDVGPWGSGLGIDVNSDGKGIYGPTEWFKIAGDQLVAKDGIYDVRLTDEYWETYFLDQYALLAVDHPAHTEIFTDERYVVPSPKPSLIATSQLKPFARATDDCGQDVTATVATVDNRFLHNFGRGQYQGLTRDHWVDLELPENAPRTGTLYLIGDGWVQETEESLMKAEEQNSTAHEHELSIEVPDANGRWSPVRSKLGFPKGRFKTIVLDITGLWPHGAPRQLRLRNNLEIYWDRLAWATGVPSQDAIKIQALNAASADLGYRGFSLITKADSSSPEIPLYDILQRAGPHWRDQEGYVTRYGDVRPLLTAVDDRYVITSPGDELRMRFDASSAPPPGWTRDFILICDGWVKDGDHNSNFADTVLPLPYHSMKNYNVPPATLEAEHAYQLHPDDWRTYHTRYVTAHDFVSALWNSR